jgi:GNAT superfamily N-acetyltransferase
MGNKAEPSRVKLDLYDVEVSYSSGGVLVGAPDDDCENTVSSWRMRLELVNYPEDDSQPEHTHIGSIRGFLVNLDSNDDPYEALDALEADLEVIGSALFQDEGIIEMSEAWPSHVVIIGHVWIDPKYRGQRLGPRAVSTAVRNFTRGRSALSAHMEENLLQLTRQKVRSAWESIGFTPFNEEVLWLEATDYEGAEYFDD